MKSLKTHTNGDDSSAWIEVKQFETWLTRSKYCTSSHEIIQVKRDDNAIGRNASGDLTSQGSVLKEEVPRNMRCSIVDQ